MTRKVNISFLEDLSQDIALWRVFLFCEKTTKNVEKSIDTPRIVWYIIITEIQKQRRISI